MKTCSVCSESKPAAEFYAAKTNRGGLHSYCKPCANAKYRERSRTGRYAETKKAWAARNRDKMREYSRKYRETSRAQVLARRALNLAVLQGVMERPGECSWCGDECVPDGHHESYEESQRLVVRWLCRGCHGALHRKEGQEI